MNFNEKDFDIMNQRLIDGYIAGQKNKNHMLTDDSISSFKPEYRESTCPIWVGRAVYYPIYRYDALYFARNDVKLTEVRKMNLINFNLVDINIERILVEHCSIMNGTFENTKFFRFCIAGRPGFYNGENEYQEFRNVVLNCRFVDCVFMNSYAEHTDWINCEFINCTFINSKLCCTGSEYKDCEFQNCDTIYVKV